MQKTFLYSVITLVCASSYAHIFQLGQIEVIADNSSDLTTTRLEYQALEKNNITNVAKVAKITPGVSFERIGARCGAPLKLRNATIKTANFQRCKIFLVLMVQNPKNKAL